MTQMLTGKEVAAHINAELAEEISQVKAQGIVPTLAIVRVGANGSDLAYEKAATNKCTKLGLDVKNYILPASCTTPEVLDVIQEINADVKLHGCLLLRPLPQTLDEEKICQALDPQKDVDCITNESLGKLFAGKSGVYPPCTAKACVEILHHYGYNLKGKKVVVVGRSLVIGKPVALLLLGEDATVTICHSKTKDLAAECQRADILIVAMGKAQFITSAYVRPGQVIIDVGINVDQEGKLCGDVDFAGASTVVEALTPVPGGVGAVTTSLLAKHVVAAARAAL